MATARQVLDGLVTQLTPLFTGFTPTVYCGVGWPSERAIAQVTQGGSSLVAVYDGDGTRNTTRWNRIQATPVTAAPAPGVTSALNTGFLSPNGGTLTITLSGTPNAQDAVVFQAQGPTAYALLGTATAVASETLDSLAAALANSINTGTYANPLVTATANDAVITITNESALPYVCSTGTANQGSVLWENRRVERHVRVIGWTQNEVIRQAVTDPIDSTLAQLENYFGYYLATGESVRVMYRSDSYVEDAQLSDVYRRDFRVSLEYGTTQLDTLYPVLANAFTFEASY